MFLQSGLACSKVPKTSVGFVPEAAHFSSSENVDSGVPPGAERGPSSGPESNVGAALEEALATLLQRAIRQRDSGYEVSAASASFLEESEKVGLSSDGSRLGPVQFERLKLTRESNPSLVIRAHERQIQRDLGVLPREPWSRHRHARDKVLLPASGYRGLRRRSSSCLGRSTCYGVPHQSICQATAYHPNKQWTYGWPLLGLDDPDGAQRLGYTPSEHAALASIATRSFWTRTRRGRSRAEAAPGKAQALQMTLEETPELEATCGPSWTR